MWFLRAYRMDKQMVVTEAVKNLKLEGMSFNKQSAVAGASQPNAVQASASQQTAPGSSAPVALLAAVKTPPLSSSAPHRAGKLLQSLPPAGSVQSRSAGRQNPRAWLTH